MGGRVGVKSGVHLRHDYVVCFTAILGSQSAVQKPRSIFMLKKTRLQSTYSSSSRSCLSYIYTPFLVPYDMTHQIHFHFTLPQKQDVAGILEANNV